MKKKLTWTKHHFFCGVCETTNRAAQEFIDHDRGCLEEDSTDAEIVNVFNQCLQCAGYGREFELKGERVDKQH